MELDEAFEPVGRDLDRVEGILSGRLRATSDTAILSMIDFLLASPGKKIRPALVLLSARLAGGIPGPELHEVAAAVELLHMASLVHDDILDGASRRRGNPTINARWGEPMAVVLGDYVYSASFEALAACGRPEIFTCISRAVKSMCEGELVQIAHRKDLELSEREYLWIVERKTASLFEACCESGAILAGAGGRSIDALRAFGHDFGMAFQIADDCEDIIALEGSGKCPGRDMACGDITLPMLAFISSAGGQDKGMLKEFLGSGFHKGGLKELRERLVASDVISEVGKRVIQLADSARRRLSGFAPSPCRAGLEELPEQIKKKEFINISG